ncbi:MAG: isochorismate synthase [Neisseriaceae bacterium]|nr:isochorismate synthase [Neisseriaceae bacterium]
MTITFNPSKDFLFVSPWRGVYSRSPLVPVAYAPNAEFGIDQAALRQAMTAGFAQLDAPKAAKAIMAGCIPFAAMDAACLYLIDEVEYCDGEEALALLQSSSKPSAPAVNPILSHQPLMSASAYKEAVARAVLTIQNHELSKVVLAQAQRLTLTHPINTVGALARLLAQNPSGYTYSVPVRERGVFIGASPELLVRQQGQYIECFPLAGTAVRALAPEQDQFNADQLLSSLKNQHEHRLVVEDIVQRLAPLVTELSVSETPELVCTSQVWHLGSKITGRLVQKGHVLDLVSLFHPTPALCGSPRDAAAAFIQVAEPFRRHYFSGAVGWCDAHGNGEWAVAIRCAEIKGHEVVVYAGAGIVADSDPEEEWVETMNKQKVILEAIL